MGARDKIIENGTDFKFNKTKNFCGETVTSLPALGPDHAGYECIYQNRIHHWTGTAWVRYAAYSEIGVTAESYAEESVNKLMPSGQYFTTPLLIATDVAPGRYEFDAEVGFARNPPNDPCAVSAQFEVNPIQSVFGTRKYMISSFGSTAQPFFVDTERSGVGFLADITAASYKSFCSDHLQVIKLHGIATLPANADVSLTYFKDTSSVSVTVRAQSWAKIRKVG